jgi:agmatine deiminase
MSNKRRMPAEWEKHKSTWIAWPHEENDWPGKFETIDWVYAEIARLVSQGEKLNIIVKNDSQRKRVQTCLELNHTFKNINLHILPTDRSWLRDSAPTAVMNEGTGSLEWIAWSFTAWAKYENYLQDKNVPPFIGKLSGIPIVQALRPDNGEPLSLEGGAIECDGQGTLMVTEECLLSKIQERNPGLSKSGYEKAFNEYLGIEKTIWLAAGCEGDDTHGHIDDIARFSAPGKVLLAFEEDPADVNHKVSHENYKILKAEKDSRGKELEITKLPMPRKIQFGEDTCPASYANFYITNNHVLVPTFNDEKDYEAIGIIRNAFPAKKVVGIGAVDLILGFGTLHCLTQQEPANE